MYIYESMRLCMYKVTDVITIDGTKLPPICRIQKIKETGDAFDNYR